MFLRPHTLLTLFLVILFLSGFVHAEKYYVVPLGDLGFTDSPINEFAVSVSGFARNEQQVVRFPDIVLEAKEAQAYISLPAELNQNGWASERQNQLLVALKLPDSKPVSGTASLVRDSTPLKTAYRFEFDPSQKEEVEADQFESIRKQHYARLSNSVIPGGDWFRYQADDAYKADSRMQRWRNLGQFDSSFNMFTGQRAVSENLALDRELILGTSEEGKVIQIDSIPGVAVPPIDWSERIIDAPTSIDALAMVIPHDQHAAFFGSIKDFNKTLTSVEQEGINFFNTGSNRETYNSLSQKYQRQMGILIPKILAEQLPVKSFAITGGDPFLPSGSDLCVIFETDAPEPLFATLRAMIAAQAAQRGSDLSPKTGTQTVQYVSADRSFSAFLFSGDGYVAVANSAKQMARLRSVTEGEIPALGTLEEFKFFRQRYPLKDEATAFVFISDATVRRWAGPAFRIGASRRVRAAAVLGQATAQMIDGAEPTGAYAELVGELKFSGQTVHSEIFNTLDFLTPISELDIEKVTPAEKAGYVRWRNGYENGWVRFDPIGLSLFIEDGSLKVDLSVIPLRVGSRYREWMRIAGDVTLDKLATTPHPESIAMFSYAIDSSSDSFKMVNNQSSAMLPGIGANPLAWVGGSLSIFLDADPFWEAAVASEHPEDYMEEHLNQLPAGLRVSSKSPLKLAIFLTTLRSFSEQAAPGLLLWESRTHGETPYVVIRTTDKFMLPGEMEIKINYAALPQAFLLSLNEDVLQRAIDRELSKAESTETEKPVSQQVFAQAKLDAFETYMKLMDADPLNKQQYTSWAALPILNEWHRLFPDQDPVETHAKYFKERIACPGARGYQWNAEIGSMESLAFGHPLAPRGEARRTSLFENWAQAQAGISFKNNELRMAGELQK